MTCLPSGSNQTLKLSLIMDLFPLFLVGLEGTSMAFANSLVSQQAQIFVRGPMPG